MNETTLTQQNHSIVTTDPGFTWGDGGVTLLIVIAALAYLYHKLWRKRGACAGGCGGKEGSCAAKKSEPIATVSVDEIKGRSNGKRH